MTCSEICLEERSDILEQRATVVSNTLLSNTLGYMVISADEVAYSLKPGQFVHLGIIEKEAHILRRPFSVMCTNTLDGTISVLYQAVGQLSTYMLSMPEGPVLSVMGPIGQGWCAPEDTTHALLVAGGAGAPALFMHAEELVNNGVEVDVVLGAKTKAELVCREAYHQILEHSPLCSTDDGSFGTAGFVTEVVETQLKAQTYDYVACCGPEPMMHAVYNLTKAYDIPTWVSLERRMACGVGACLSCVVDTIDGKKRSCVDGPVFDAGKVQW